MLKSLIEIPQLQISNLTFYTKKSLSQELLYHCRLYILRLLFTVFTICKSILTFLETFSWAKERDLMISYKHQLIKDSKQVTLFSDRNKRTAVGCSLPLGVLFFFLYQIYGGSMKISQRRARVNLLVSK